MSKVAAICQQRTNILNCKRISTNIKYRSRMIQMCNCDGIGVHGHCIGSPLFQLTTTNKVYVGLIRYLHWLCSKWTHSDKSKIHWCNFCHEITFAWSTLIFSVQKQAYLSITNPTSNDYRNLTVWKGVTYLWQSVVFLFNSMSPPLTEMKWKLIATTWCEAI